MQKLADEVLTLAYTKPLVERFKAIRAELDVLNGLKGTYPPLLMRSSQRATRVCRSCGT